MNKGVLCSTCACVFIFTFLHFQPSEASALQALRVETYGGIPIARDSDPLFRRSAEAQEGEEEGTTVESRIPEELVVVVDRVPILVPPLKEENIPPSSVILGSPVNLSEDISENATVTGRAACQCGRPSRRIVGGEAASINDYPWTAALTRGGSRPYCGGTLINNFYVVTASHCVDGMSARGIEVVLNQENVYNSPQSQRYLVSKITMHSGYDRRVVDNDIALLRLSQPVRLDQSSAVVPVCLPATNAVDFAGITATVAGWGATAQGASTSNTLRKVDIPVLSNSQCNRESRYRGKITENMMCAGLLASGGKDSCQGDSGGPLIIENGGRRTLIGIVSWGYGCAQPKSPGVYTRVGKYPEWILANTKDADWCQG